MTKIEFAAVTAFIVSATGKTMPQNQMEVYFDLLGDLPGAAVLAAAKRVVLEGDGWIPPVGKIRAAALALVRPPELTWGEAWDLACAAARRFGLDRPREGLESLPGSVASAARAIGWRCLCDATEGQMDTLRAQFRDVYKPIAERDQRAAMLPPSVRQAVAQIAGAGLKLLTDDASSEAKNDAAANAMRRVRGA